MRVAVVLHERLGGWNRQLRPRLAEMPVRWFESRSVADLEAIVEGVAFPVVLIDLGGQPFDGLIALDAVRTRATGAQVLVLDPQASPDRRDLAYELGATHVHPGFAPPPFVAALVARWVALARSQTQGAGWSRTTFPESAAEPWAWLSEYLSPSAEPPAWRPTPSPILR